MPGARSAYCIFCDDIRHEISNKTSLIGVYNADMIFDAAPPVVIPKLGISLWVISDLDDRPSKLVVRVIAPDGGDVPEGGEILRADLGATITGSLPYSEGALKAQMRATLQLSPIPLMAEGYIEVWVDTERESFRAGRLFISFRRPPEPAQSASASPA